MPTAALLDEKLVTFATEHPEYFLEGQIIDPHVFLGINGAAAKFFQDLTESEQLEFRERYTGGLLG